MTSSFFQSKAEAKKKRNEEKELRMQEAIGKRSPGHKPYAQTVDVDDDPRFAGTKGDRATKHIPLASIIAKDQVRTEFDESALQELVDSLNANGQQQAALVYWSDGDQKYVIIAGERRFRAAKRADSIETLLCRVHPNEPTPEELLELSFIENAVRKNLKPLEEALVYKRFQEEFGYTTTKIAERTGKNQSTISRALSLLKLPKPIQEQLRAGKLPTSVAREIAKVKDEAEQLKMAAEYRAGKLTTAKAQERTNKKKRGGPKSSSQTKRWTVDGVNISVSIPRGVTMADVAAALMKKHNDILSDG